MKEIFSESIAKRFTAIPVFLLFVFTFVSPLFIMPAQVSAAGDDFNLSQAQIGGGSPSDVATWSTTATITNINLTPSVNISFDKADGPNMWPDQTNLGVDDIAPADPIQYTIWMFRQIGGKWIGAGFIRLWHGAPQSGLALENTPCDWFYYVPEMQPERPLVAGEQIGFMVTAGVERRGTFTKIKERSNVKVATVPNNLPASHCQGSGGGGSTGGTSAPTSTRTPTPTPDKSVAPATAGFGGSLAYNSAADNWLVVSQDGQKNIVGQLMDKNNKKTGAAIKITSAGENLSPRVGYASDINKFLVAWLRSNTNTDTTVWGQFVNPDGSLSGAPIQIDRGTFLFHANTSVQYDSKNHQFVITWENRAAGVQVALNTLSSTGQPGTRVNVTTSSAGTFNGAPSVAVNENENQYCVMYQHVVGSRSEVTVVPVSPGSGQVGQSSALISDSQFTYNIVYNSQDNVYMGIWANAEETELQGKVFSGCKGSLDDDPLFIGDNYHNGNIAYNPKSNSYAVVVQEHSTSDNHLYILNSDGGVMDDSVIFGGSSAGNFDPRVAANTTTGLYAAITSEGHATTKFTSSLGSSELANNNPSKPQVPLPAQTVVPVPDKGLPTDLGQLIQAIFDWSLGIVGLVIFMQFFRAGLKWFGSQGSSSAISEAQNMMRNAAVGAAILFSAYLILNTINPDLVKSTFNLPGLPASQDGLPTVAQGGGTIPPPAHGPSHADIVQNWRSKYPATSSMTANQIVEMLRGIATDVNKTKDMDGPFGILKKPGSICNNYSCDIICSGQGTGQRQWDVLGDSDPGTGKQIPGWTFVTQIAVRDCEILN